MEALRSFDRSDSSRQSTSRSDESIGSSEGIGNKSKPSISVGKKRSRKTKTSPYKRPLKVKCKRCGSKHTPDPKICSLYLHDTRRMINIIRVHFGLEPLYKNNKQKY